METVVLFDADFLAFRAASAIEKRTVRITHLTSGKSKVFDTRTEHKKSQLAKGVPFDKAQWTFEDIQTAQAPAAACSIVKNTINQVMAKLWGDHMEIAIGGKRNFRDDLPLPKKYKDNRVDMIRPVHLQEVKRYIWKAYDAPVIQGHEVDDWVIYRGYELQRKGYDVVLCVQDKDTDAYTGLKVYDPTKENPEIVLLPDFGSLWDAPHNKVKGNGFIWFCFQWLNGDSTDHYKPCELSGARFADGGALKVLKDCTTKREALMAVVEQYQKWYPEPFSYTAWDGRLIKSDYKHMLDLYFKCARMMTTADDKLDAMKFLEEHDINL